MSKKGLHLSTRKLSYSMREILIAFALLAVAICCWKAAAMLHGRLYESEEARRLARVLRSLNESQPARDVAAHLSRGDARYVACRGESGGPVFPGISKAEWPVIQGSGNFWVIDGNTGAAESGYHRQLIDRAWQYARRYNEELQRKTKNPQ